MKTIACVPCRPDGGAHDLNWAYCQHWLDDYSLAAYEPRFDVDYDAPYVAPEWNVARVRNALARAAGDWDRMIVSDMDIVLDSRALSTAIKWCGPLGYVACHDILVMLGPAASTRVLHDGESPGDVEREKAVGRTWEVPFVIGRELWDTIGGYDERLTRGSGVALAHAAHTLGRTGRVPGTIYHLWHPAVWDREEHNPRFHAEETLRARYRAADADGIRALIAERTVTA